MKRYIKWASLLFVLISFLSAAPSSGSDDRRLVPLDHQKHGKKVAPQRLPKFSEMLRFVGRNTGINAFIKEYKHRDCKVVLKHYEKYQPAESAENSENARRSQLFTVSRNLLIFEKKTDSVKHKQVRLKESLIDGFGTVYPEGTVFILKSVNEIAGIGRIIMIFVGFLLLYLGIVKKFEPLLLVTIAFGCILSNIPLAGIAGPKGLIGMVYHVGIDTGVFPLLIFMGVGAMTDFGPLIANPKTLLLGAAAQFGIFLTLIGALALTKYIPGINFTLQDAGAIGIIGGADGPTAIFLASRLSPRLLGSIAVAAYSYMALVPIIQPPIMRLLTNPAERKIRMTQLRHVGKAEKIIFPIIVVALCGLLLPDAVPLIGMLMFGNLMNVCGVVDRLSETAKNALINIVTIFLGLAVGSKLSAAQFLNLETLGILLLGVTAFAVGTASGLGIAKFMNLFLKTKINPLIGSAGVSAVPMAARVAQDVGAKEDPQNFLLMHAMGPNVAGVLGSAVAAGVLLSVLGG